MELGKQIKKYRNELSLSQDALAQRLYVSRQTISNWENDKSYPDVHSLVLLSDVFHISIDNLIKGDVEVMKEKIKEEDVTKFKRINVMFMISIIVTLISFIPLVHFFNIVGFLVWWVIWGISMYFGIIVLKRMKKHNIYTYKEILAFINKTELDEIAKAREEGKRVYQFIIGGVIGAILAVIFIETL